MLVVFLPIGFQVGLSTIDYSVVKRLKKCLLVFIFLTKEVAHFVKVFVVFNIPRSGTFGQPFLKRFLKHFLEK